jgi:hypothetical protein
MLSVERSVFTPAWAQHDVVMWYSCLPLYLTGSAIIVPPAGDTLKSFRSWLLFWRLSFAVFEETPSLGGWLILALGLSLFVELNLGDVLGDRGGGH